MQKLNWKFYLFAIIAVCLSIWLPGFLNIHEVDIFEAGFTNDLPNLLSTSIKHSLNLNYSDDIDKIQHIIDKSLIDINHLPIETQNYICKKRDRFGNTLLHWVVKANNVELLKTLLNLECMSKVIHIRNNAHTSLLHWASTTPGPTESFTNLLEQDPEVLDNLPSDPADMPMTGVIDDSPRYTNECLEILIQKGLDINNVNKSGETPLHWAIHWNSLHSVRTLLYEGANVSISDEYGNKPLHKTEGDCVGNKTCSHLVSLMLTAGASAVDENQYGRKTLEHFDYRKVVPTITRNEEIRILSVYHSNKQTDNEI